MRVNTYSEHFTRVQKFANNIAYFYHSKALKAVLLGVMVFFYSLVFLRL